MKRPISIVIDDLTAWMREKASPEEDVIASIWSRTDFSPQDWEKLMRIWTRADSERLNKSGWEFIKKVLRNTSG